MHLLLGSACASLGNYMKLVVLKEKEICRWAVGFGDITEIEVHILAV